MSATAKQIGTIHALAAQAGLDEDTRRDLMERETGQRSAKEMTEAQAASVIQALARQAPARRPSERMDGPYAPILRALWLAAYNLGVARSRDDRALIAFVTRQTGLEHPRFLVDAGAAKKAIEGLKAWLAREAGYEVPTARDGGLAARRALVRAQWRALQKLGAVTPGDNDFALAAYVSRVATGLSRAVVDLDDPRLTPVLLDQVSRALGAKLRTARERQAIVEQAMARERQAERQEP
jgi:hypothetical protein